MLDTPRPKTRRLLWYYLHISVLLLNGYIEGQSHGIEHDRQIREPVRTRYIPRYHRTLKGGVLYYTCPGWRFGPRDPQTGRKRDCRHVRHVREHEANIRQCNLAFCEEGMIVSDGIILCPAPHLDSAQIPLVNITSRLDALCSPVA